MPDAIAYVRFSTAAQDKGDSERRQRASTAEFCTKKGWTLTDTLTDLGASAWKGHHLKDAAALGGFANRVRQGLVPPGTILVVEDLDRLSRQQPIDVFQWMLEMSNLGIRIATVKDERMFDSEKLRGPDAIMSVMQVFWEADRARKESTRKSDLVSAAWRKKQAEAKDGKILTLRCPGWLEVKPDRSGFNILPQHAATVQRIFQMAADGMTARGMAKLLNQEDVPAWGHFYKREQNEGWEGTNISKLLRSPAPEGDYIPNGEGERIVGYYPRVVDADLVERARAGIQRAKSRSGPQQKSNYADLFQTLTRCGACGGRMAMRKNKTQRYWQCHSAGVGKRCKHRTFYRYNEFETAALDAVLNVALSDNYFVQPDDSLRLSVQAAEARKRIGEEEARIKRLTRAISLIDNADDLIAEMGEVRASITQQQADLKALEAALAKARGKTSPAEHLQRVRAVRADLASKDELARVEARRRVWEALKEVVQFVSCTDKDKFRGAPEKTMTLVMIGGVQAFKFDAAGTPLGQVDVFEALDRDPAVRSGLTGDLPATEARLDTLLRRRAR